MAIGFFKIIEQLYQFFANPGAHETLLKMQKTLGLKAREIAQLSDSRKTLGMSLESVEAVKINFAAILKSLQDLSDPVFAFSAEAAGLALHIQKAEFLVALLIFEDFFAHDPRCPQSPPVLSHHFGQGWRDSPLTFAT